jgi:PAS domain S-box-containing protein
MEGGATMKNAYPQTADKGGSTSLSSIPNDIFYKIAENASDMIIHFKIRPEEVLAYISPSSTRIIGYTPEEIYADSNIIRSVVYQNDKELFRDFIHSNSDSNQRPAVIRWIHKNGNIIWTEQTKAVIRNDRGEAVDSYFICRDVTDNRLAEIALQESQKFNASLLDNAPHAVVVINPDTSVAYVNPAWEQLNGWTLAEIAGTKAPYPWWPDDLKEQFLAGFKESFKQEGGKGEIISRKKNGEIYWIDMNWTAVKHNNELLYILINSIDITERKRAEDAVKALSARQEAILSAVPDIIVEVNTNKVYTWANRAGLEFFGDDIIGKPADYYFEGKQDVFKKVQPLFNGYEDIIYIESWQRRRDGKKRLLAWWCRAMKDGKGHVTGALSSARDITESKQMEDALSRESVRRRILIEQSSDGIVIIDQNGKVHEANRRFAEMLGYSSGEILDLHVWDWDIQWEKEQLLEWLGKVTDAGEHIMTCNRRKDGTIFDVEISTNAAIISGQKFVFCVCRDMTEHNRAEQALRESEEKFSKAFTSSPNPICIFTIEDHKFIEVNESFIRFSGYSREEIIAHTPKQLNLWVEPGELEKMGNILRETGKLDNYTVKSRMKSGEIRTGLFSADIMDISGKKCTIIVITDITEQVKAKEALRESEEKFSKAFLASPGIIAITTLKEGKFIEVSDTYGQYTGYSRQELIGKTASSLNIWVNIQERERMFKILAEKGKVSNEEFNFRTKSGEIRTWLFCAEPIHLGGEPCLLGTAIDITERRKMEEALKSSEEKFRELVNTSVDGIISIDEKFQIMVWNQGAKRIFGYTEKEMLGESILKLIPEKPRQMMQQYYEHHKRPLSNVPVHRSFESTCVRKDGKTVPIDISVSSRKVGNSFIATAIIRDISERQQMEKAVRESEEKFSKAFSSSPNAICIVTADKGNFIEINESFIRFTGYSRKETIGATPAKLGLWITSDNAKRITRILKETGRLNNEEVKSRMKSGEIRTGLFSAETIDIGGRQSIILEITDITEQVEAKSALRESEEKFSAAFRASPDMMSIIDLQDGKYTEVNDSYVSFSGYSREEIIGHTVEEVGLFVSREEMDKMAQLMQKTGQIRHAEVHIRTKSGKIRTWMFSADVIKVGGKPCALAVCTDITERKRAEKALRESEEKFATAFNSSPDMMFITSSEGRYLEINESYVRISGFTREEVLGHKTTEINTWVAPGDRDKILSKIKQNGRIYNEECPFKVKSGDIHTILFSTEVINIAGERCLISVGTDITERIKAEKALRESEEKFFLAFNSSPDMMVITSMKSGKYVDVNDSFVRNTGYSREELLTTKLEDLHLWANDKDALRMTRAMEKEGKFRNEEYDFRTKSGDIRTWRCSGDMLTIGGEPMMLAVASDITEQKKSREALRESEEKFSKAFHSSPFSISISRLSDGIFVEVNDAFCRDKGYTREEIIGHSSREVNIWADKKEGIRLIETVRAGKKIVNEEFQFRTKDGYVRTGLVSSEILSIGNEPCMLVMNNDITQQKQAAEQLRLLSSVTQQVSDSTIITDPKFNITYMNRAAQDLLGYTLDEVRGKNLAMFNAFNPADRIRRSVKHTVSSGEVFSDVISKRRKDGSTIICDCRLSPLYDQDGKIRSYIDVERDVTRQKEVEQKLQEHKNLIDSILATMPEGVLVIDSKDRVVLANKAFQNIFRTGRKVLNEKLLHEILPVDQFFNLHKTIKTKEAEKVTLEFRYKVQNTEKIIFCIIVKMDGELTLLTFSDVSGEREEEEKLYLADRLVSLGEMAAGLAHELNNPLTGILALSQLLTTSDIPKDYQEDIECIHEEAKRAANIVKNVLLFARNKPDENGSSCVNEVLTDVLRLREYEQKANNIKVVTNLQDQLPNIPIDNGQLQQVFLNIISNAEAAIKDTKRPGLITVNTERVNNHINIIFKDNGSGIKKNVMPRIFDPFFTTKEIGKGTGLGLSICYSIIVKHGGKINVSSQVNEGAMFTIKMPIVAQV